MSFTRSAHFLGLVAILLNVGAMAGSGQPNTTARPVSNQPPIPSTPSSLASSEQIDPKKQAVNMFVFLRSPDRGLPANRRQISLRSSSCTSDSVPLTLLVPTTNLAITNMARPVFFWYTPTLKTLDVSVYFRLMSREKGIETQVYMREFSGNQLSNRIVQFPLPTDAPTLNAGSNYRWSVSIQCSPEDPSGNIVADAWISRERPEQIKTSQWTTLPLDEQARRYARAGLWPETLTALSTVDPEQTQSLTRTYWKQLLISEELPDLIGKEIAK
jgi:Domain of Unknown Function (DUF928)